MKTTIYSYHKRGKKNHFLFLCVIFFFSHFLWIHTYIMYKNISVIRELFQFRQEKFELKQMNSISQREGWMLYFLLIVSKTGCTELFACVRCLLFIRSADSPQPFQQPDRTGQNRMEPRQTIEDMMHHQRGPGRQWTNKHKTFSFLWNIVAGRWRTNVMHPCGESKFEMYTFLEN